ncbi:glycosyltransferase [Jiella avicenniae]|uniref:Glycosyltransferase n=1 Tax=Jiella avicenniae TaxID=2907202 RepID=A0A9X1P0Q8_9HYPH|nr:glycosyltransferase [Jiella avicenniae]MCE7028952.1 glycosyltransferase [Jiella avicenniae]
MFGRAEPPAGPLDRFARSVDGPPRTNHAAGSKSPNRETALHAAGLTGRRPLVVLTGLLALVSLFFLGFPGIDTSVSALFYRPHLGFVGNDSLDLTIIRGFGNWMTIAAVGAGLLAVLGALLVRTGRWSLAPSEALYLLSVYAIGPGLIVNAILKNAIGRARPRELTQFGGSLDFTPVWEWGGACTRNCSFSSGEAAAAAAILTFVVLVRREDRLSLCLGLSALAATVSAARIAAGGHFLSDVLVSWVIVLATIIALRPVFLGPRGRRIDEGFAKLRRRLRSRLPSAAASLTFRSRASNFRESVRFSGATGTTDCDIGAPMDAFPAFETATEPRNSRRFAMVSVVVPAKNEADNLAILVPEIAAALASRGHEILVVDDGSNDGTPAAVARLRADGIAVRHIRHERSAGQSRAVRTGVIHAAGDCVVTIDGDGQNDPAFIPAMVDLLERSGNGCGLVAGQRTGRTDTFAKRLSSKAANRLRTAILKDATRDTGCGLKALPTELFRRLPFFDGWHRYLPALVLREERTIAHLDVKDRQRRFGSSNYGIFDRAARGALDLFGVWWIIRRGRRTPGEVVDVTAAKEH